VVAVKSDQAERVLSGGLDRTPVVLIHGPDHGLVLELCRLAVTKAGVPQDDPFRFVRIPAETIAADPGRLADEAGTVALFGGRRLIWCVVGARNLAPLVEPLLAAAPADLLVILQAGELKAGTPLRALCETSDRALSIICYADESTSLDRLASETLAKVGKTIEPDALRLVVERLGSDRALSRLELDKLVSYLGDRAVATGEDVLAIVGDTARIEPSRVIDLAFSGDVGAIETEANRALEDGLDAGVLLGNALRHANQLLALRADLDRGEDFRAAFKRQGFFFRREGEIRRQAGLWRAPELISIANQLASAIEQTRRTAPLGRPIAVRALWATGLAAGRAARPVRDAAAP
jgi:DNA polymerase-3 subunit delta